MSCSKTARMDRQRWWVAQSSLDQYAMGLVDQTQVPPFFYVENPTNVSPPRAATSNPEVGVTFSGTRRTVTIDDVIAVHGQRAPSAADSPRVYRQAFIYVVSAGGTVDAAAIEKLDRIRVAWDQFFSAATDSRMRAETRVSLWTSTQ
jgi:large repetitive protein